MIRFTWNDGAAVVRLGFNGRCDWAYCGGPVCHDVKLTHFVAAIESLLGWDHPTAREAHAWVKSVS